MARLTARDFAINARAADSFPRRERRSSRENSGHGPFHEALLLLAIALAMLTISLVAAKRSNALPEPGYDNNGLPTRGILLID